MKECGHTWILGQGRNGRKFRLLTLTSLVGHFVHLVEEEGMV